MQNTPLPLAKGCSFRGEKTHRSQKMHFEVLETSCNGDIFIVLLQVNNGKKRVKCGLDWKGILLLFMDFIPEFCNWMQHL